MEPEQTNLGIFTIEKLPLDLLTEILSLKVGDAALRLWKCGSPVLNMKLANCVHVVMLKDRVPLSTSRWPTILSHFRKLRKLVIFRPLRRLDTLANVRSGLQSLSTTLEHLELYCLESLAALYPEESVETSAPGLVSAIRPPAGHLESSSQDAYVRKNQPGVGMWDLNAFFPNLLWLAIGGQGEDRSVLLRDEDLAFLPRSLTYLELCHQPSVKHIAPSWDRLDLLPRGLQTLKISLQDFDGEWSNRLQLEMTATHVRALPPSSLLCMDSESYLTEHPRRSYGRYPPP